MAQLKDILRAERLFEDEESKEIFSVRLDYLMGKRIIMSVWNSRNIIKNSRETGL